MQCREVPERLIAIHRRATRLAATFLPSLIFALAACADPDAIPAGATESPESPPSAVSAEAASESPSPRDQIADALALVSGPPPSESAASGAASASASSASRGPATSLPANELGEIMVLEYHRLGDTDGPYHRTPEHFAQDLQNLYDAGFRPITIRQMISGDIDLPAGTSPVVFTIDDSSEGQFYLRADGSIDPNSMVGIWSAFARANPAWGNGATWCVLPAADYPSNFFGERPSHEVDRATREARIRTKVDYLIGNGHEICNHTLYHARLDKAKDRNQVQEWIGRGEDSIRVYLPPEYEIVTIGLPLGMWPATRSLAWSGSWNGQPYEYQAVLEVTGGPNPSPFDREFDAHSINRVIVAPGALPRALTRYEREPGKRYISDGDPQTIAVPDSLAARVAIDRWPRLRLRTINPGAM